MKYDRLTFYKGRSLVKGGSWRWRFQAAGNGAKLANGGESYKHLADAIAGAARVTAIPVNAVALTDNQVHPYQYKRCDGTMVEIVFKW